MEYLSGGGKVYDGGEWDVKETPKMLILNQTKQPFFDSGCPHTMRLRKDNRGPHCIKIVDDQFLIYPFRSGTPHIFAPL